MTTVIGGLSSPRISGKPGISGKVRVSRFPRMLVFVCGAIRVTLIVSWQFGSLIYGAVSTAGSPPARRGEREMRDMRRKTNTHGKLAGHAKLSRLSRLSFVACTNLKRRCSCVICITNGAYSVTNGAFHATIRYKNALIFKFAKRRQKTAETPYKMKSYAFHSQVKRGRNATEMRSGQCG
jgi:hypothetical protein